MKLKKIIKFIRTGYEIMTLKGGFHEIEKALKKQYYTSSSLKGIKDLSVIVMVDGKNVHGGLADRLRGIVSVYHYCKQRKIPFRIHFNYPFKLKDYLEPNRYDWQIASEDISYHPDESEPVLLTLDKVPSKLHRFYLNRLIKKYPDKQLHIYTNTMLEDKHFTQDFNELFKPSDKLQERVDNLLNQLPSKYIGVVFRFQQLLGDFKEDGYKILSEEERRQLIEKCIRKVEELHASRHPDKPFLVASDSSTFMETIHQQKDYAHIIAGKVVHMDYTEGANFNIYSRSFTDMLLLSKAEKVYLFKTGDMYRSGFGKRAALITGTEYEEILF